MKSDKYSLVVLSILLILLLFIGSASAADSNGTDVLSADKSTDTVEKLALDSSLDNAASNDTNVLRNNGNDLLSMDNNVKSNELSDDTLKISNDELLTAGNSWYVNSSKTSSGDGSSDEKAFQTLKKALDKAENGDIIMIASGTYTGTDNRGLSIDKKLSFEKYGDDEAIFDAENQSRIWEVSAATININGLTFKNGKSNGYGGAISMDEGNVINCTFTGNNVTGSSSNGGGAIYMDEGNVINCTFTGNTANGSSTIVGGAIYCIHGTNVINCNFTGNYARYGGGAIYLMRGGNVSDCTFTNNNATYWGGAIRLETYDDTKGNVTNCAFVNNTAKIKAISSSRAPESVDNNWWGSNNPNWDELIDKAGIPSSYAVLNGSADATTIKPGSKAKLTYGFYSNATGDLLSIPSRPIELSATGGHLDDDTGYLVNGEFSTEFSSEALGEFEITAAVDNQEVKLTETVAATVWYVNATAAPGGDGKSNETAFQTLNEALTDAENGDIIMIASGTYTGDKNVGLQINQNNLNLIKYGDRDAICDGQSAGEILYLDTSSEPRSINIKGLNFKNAIIDAIGFYGEYGVSDSSINATFVNIGNGKWGSAIFANSANNVDITGTFINNTAGEGLIKLGNVNNINIHDSIFINNGESTIFMFNGSSLIYNNWFGNTADDYNTTPAGVKEGQMINWLFLNATADPSEIGIGSSSTITFDLYYLNFGTVNKYDGPLNIQLNLTQTLGKLDKTAASLGEKITYTAMNVGDASVTATFETASYTLKLKNSGIPTVLNLYRISPGEYNPSFTVDIGGTVKNKMTGATIKKGSVKLYLNGENVKNITVDGDDGSISYSFEVLDAGNYTVKAVYHDDTGEFLDCELNSSFEIKQAPTEITINNTSIELIIGNGTIIEAVLNPSEAGNLNYSSNDTSVAVVNENGEITAVGAGTANITVSFEGNNNYAASQNYTVVTVSKISTKIDLTEDGYAVYVDDIYDNLAVLQDVDGNNITDGYTLDYASSDESVVKIVDDSFVAVGEGLATITVSFNGNDKYESADDASFKVGVVKKESSIDIEPKSIEIVAGEDAPITVILPEDATGIVLVDVGDNKYYGDVENGNATVNIAGLTAGNYTAKVIYPGDDKYINASSSVSIKVNEIPEPVDSKVNVTVPDVKVGETAKAVVELPSDATGNVIVRVDGKEAAALIVYGGTVEIPLGVLTAGNHTVVAVYSGNSKYDVGVATKDITVEKLTTNITADSVEVVEGETATVTVTVDENATGTVLVEVGANKYYADISNGKAAVDVVGLTAGEYTAEITYTGDDKYGEAKTTAAVKVDAQPAPKTESSIAIVEVNGYNITGILSDDSGKGIADAQIKYAVNGTEKTVMTAKDGSFVIEAMPNSPVSIDYAGDNTTEPTKTSITIKEYDAPVPVKLTSEFNITNRAITITGYAVDGPAGEQGIYYATELLDENGNPIKNVYIEFAVNNKIYNRTTYENGSFKPYKLNMVRAGRYTMAFNFAGDDNYTNAFACVCVDLSKKPITIKASSKSYKATTKTKKYTVTLSTIKGLDGKMYLSPKKVSLKVNGKTYTVKTNSKGVATFKITNLTKKAKYSAVISYEGDKTYESASKKVTITAK